MMLRSLIRAHAGDDVVFDREWGRTLLAYFARFTTERGGVLVGKRSTGPVEITAAVFPPQRVSTATRCSFDTGVIEGVHETLSDVRRTERGDHGTTVLGWVHSHPRMGVFLSDQDRHTLTTWTSLDAAAVALVADPFAQSSQIRAWGDRCAPRPIRVRDESEGLMLDEGVLLADALSGVVDPGLRGLWDIVGSAGVISISAVRARPAAGPAEEER
ncbi:Mov34/MPN/PAD-1 family protein [Streptomyces sp. NPDC001843]|uniref:Mov34/MPN/PAD-1 family protein n=1 Tax=Streptomyces sp. NPDC001843 TaxID=3364617 RepID=UPI00368508CC